MAEQEKHLDHLLDSLLATYSDVQPRPGFQTRLLAVVREPRPWFRLGWLWAGAAAAITAMAVFAIYFSRMAELPAPPRIEVARPPILPPTRMVAVQDATPHRQNIGVKSETLVTNVGLRQEVFPSPAPLSEQERLMLRYLSGTPRDEVAAHAREDEPVEAVEPLRPESQRFNKTEVYSTR